MYNSTVRQITLDTETTGVNKIDIHYKGHNIIEIGAVEIINRILTGNNFHVYINPSRLIDPEAFKIHGISNEFLANKPSFANIANEFLDYIQGSELIIHNALFDLGFINYEFSKLNKNIPKINTICKVTDSLALARKMFPGKRNSLDALCLRYKIDSNKRKLHSALVDARILADIYLNMTSGQISIPFLTEENTQHKNTNDIKHNIRNLNISKLRVILANNHELLEHKNYIQKIKIKSGNCFWNL